MGKKSREQMTGKTLEDKAKGPTPTIPEPSQDVLRKLVELKIAAVENNKYIYSAEFKSSFADLIAHPPGFYAQTRLANKINNELIPLFLSHGHIFLKKGTHGYENIVEAYAGYDRHVKLLNLQVNDKDVPNIIYGTYYLNDHEPEVTE